MARAFASLVAVAWMLARRLTINFAPLVLLMVLRRHAVDARRKLRTRGYFVWSAVAALCSAIIALAAIAGFLLFYYFEAWWFGVIWVALLMIPTGGAALVRHLLVPIGAVRTTYVIGWACRPGADPVAYGLACGAWALAHDSSGTGEAWLARRRDTRQPLGDAEVVCTALMLAARGDAEGARTLLRSVTMLVEDHPAVRELAGEWLACDAAERGAWKELAADASAMAFPATPLTWLLEGVAARRIGQPGAPSDTELWMRWVLAPRRAASVALVHAAIAVARVPSPPEPVTSDADSTSSSTNSDMDGGATWGTSSEGTTTITLSTAAASSPTSGNDLVGPPTRAPLPRAIAAHLAFAATKPNPTAFAATVRAWDAALADGATHSWLARRALELDAPLGAVDRALREVSMTVTEDLARMADAAQLGAPTSHGPVGDGLSRRLRHGRLDTLEAGFTRWADRRSTGEVHPAIDEWREFVALRDAYTAAVTAGGSELRRLAFPHAFSTGSNMAAWLWNARNEYPLSHAISKWLLQEALAVGDTEAIELGHRNCGLYVPTRAGDPSKP